MLCLIRTYDVNWDNSFASQISNIVKKCSGKWQPVGVCGISPLQSSELLVLFIGTCTVFLEYPIVDGFVHLVTNLWQFCLFDCCVCLDWCLEQMFNNFVHFLSEFVQLVHCVCPGSPFDVIPESIVCVPRLQKPIMGLVTGNFGHLQTVCPNSSSSRINYVVLLHTKCSIGSSHVSFPAISIMESIYFEHAKVLSKTCS